MLEHFGVPAFRISPVFTHKRHTSKTQFQLRTKLVFRQITLDAKPLFPVRIENNHGWRPQSVETMEVNRVFFDVCLERHEVGVDKRSSLVIAVRLGFQPSTCASGRSGAEVDEQRLLLSFRFRECRVSVCQPMYFHA
jgi:hypothetical protein